MMESRRSANPHAEKILASLQQAEQLPARPTRLTLQSSSVELAAYASCGNGESYNSVPRLNHPSDWPVFKDAFYEAALKENTSDVLTGAKQTPVASAATDMTIEGWNEYILQTAIFNRRNNSLLGGLRGRLGPALKARLIGYTSATALWTAMEKTCTAPPSSDRALALFHSLLSTSLESCGNVLDQYVHVLESRWLEIDQLHAGVVDTRDSTRSEGVICMIFLENLGAEHHRLAIAICKKYNVGGYGTGERVGFKALADIVKQAIEPWRVANV